MNVGTYKKFIIAVAAAVGVLATAVADGNVSTEEGIAIVLAFLGSLGVYGAKNAPYPPEETLF